MDRARREWAAQTSKNVGQMRSKGGGVPRRSEATEKSTCRSADHDESKNGKRAERKSEIEEIIVA